MSNIFYWMNIVNILVFNVLTLVCSLTGVQFSHFSVILVDLTKSFGFGLECESVTGFDVKSETESLNGFVLGFGPNAEFKNPKPNL
jgi:hypothetical protein